MRSYWLRRLLASVRTLQRDIARGGEAGISAAQSAFIHRHTTLLRDAYLAGHKEGQRDYWGEVSLTPTVWMRRAPVTPSVRQVQQRLLFYGAASVVKLAREVAATWRIGHTTLQQTQAQPRTQATARPPQGVALADPPADLAWGKFTAWASPRIGLQADVTWSGFQDGYVDAASADAAGLKLQLWWELEPSAQHCDDCPLYAAGSPYDAPGSGGNELDATPGDGHTACGASCKCGLRYGWTNVRGLAAAGAGANARDFEVLIPPNVRPAVPAAPDDWEARRQAAIDQALQAQQGGGGSTSWPERDEAIAQVGGVYGRPRPPGWTGTAGTAGNAPGQIDTTRVQTAGGDVSVTRDMVRVTPGDESAEPQALAALNAGQKQALDDIRGLALLWDATRGGLPAFETYFDPASASNLWQNPHLAGLDATQRELVARFFRALVAFEDETPMGDD